MNWSIIKKLVEEKIQEIFKFLSKKINDIDAKSFKDIFEYFKRFVNKK